ncbi:MAG TPA: MerC family mercury resistance protein [Sphingopyxis sp.]|nr:MerC family mercury resistance protein [Sphingopyxis sp.]HMP44497.1 MerC family mercury resistance protein [Sphingopyxis sp.]
MCLPVSRRRLADMAGITLSATYLLHCLGLPLLLSLAPALGIWMRLPEGLHAAILLLALAAMLGSHRRRPALAATAGLALLALGLAAHEGWTGAADPEAADRLFTSLGALLLAAAHVANWRLRHRGPVAHPARDA